MASGKRKMGKCDSQFPESCSENACAWLISKRRDLLPKNKKGETK